MMVEFPFWELGQMRERQGASRMLAVPKATAETEAGPSSARMQPRSG